MEVDRPCPKKRSKFDEKIHILDNNRKEEGWMTKDYWEKAVGTKVEIMEQHEHGYVWSWLNG